MPAEITLPVFMRIGPAKNEVQIGEYTFPVQPGNDAAGRATSFDRAALAALLRAAAEEIESRSDDEGVSDAAADG